MKRVLVLDANQRSSLAVIRSLGKHKVPIITADETPDALAGCSRYSQQYFSYPSPSSESEHFISTIVSLCRSENIGIILPMTELTTTLLLENQAKLLSILLPFPSIDIVNTLSDKNTLMHLAESLNIPVPKTYYASSTAQLPIKLNEINYPLVLKPGKSWLQHKDSWIHTEVKIAEKAAAAAKILQSDPSYQIHPFMLQEFVPGSGGGIFAIYDHGRPIAFFAHRRLREKPPRGGVSVLSESTALNPKLETYARKLLDHVNWHGVAMVEFRITPEGQPYLMEVNTRFWGSLQLAIDAGVDFPWLLYRAAAGEQPGTVSHYKIGIRLRWLLGDVDSLYLVLRDKDVSLKVKLAAITQFLTPHPFKTRHEVNRLSDIKPFFWELKQYIKDLLKN